MGTVSTQISLLSLSIGLLVFLIVRLKIHASLALIFASMSLGLAMKIPLEKLVATIQDGIGSTLAFLALIMGFGAILGKMLDDSGGAERIARTLLDKAGSRNAPWVMAAIGFVVGIPVFSDVGFLLMVPLVLVVARNAGMTRQYVGVPLLLSLHVIHCIVPPHPAATAVTTIMQADIGNVIILGLLIALPCTLAGTYYVKLITERGGEMLASDAEASPARLRRDDEMPGFAITMLTILLPLLIMVSKTLSVAFMSEGNVLLPVVNFIGNPFTALLISVCFAFWSLGLARGKEWNALALVTNDSYRQIANVMLIIACGGAFNAVIAASGINHVIGQTMSDWPVSPIILAWLLTGVLHLAVGSATVAMLGASGIILPMLAANPHLSSVAMTLAIGSGAIGFVQFTDSLIWLGKEYLGLSMGQAIKSISGATMIASCCGLAGALLINMVH